MNKAEFEAEVGGEKVKLAVKKPTARQKVNADGVRAKAFKEALDAGAILRDTLARHVRAQKLWDDEREKELAAVLDRLREGEKIVEGRVKGTAKEAARQAALKLMRDREELVRLRTEKLGLALDGNTAEAMADNTRFDYLVSVCTVYPDDRPFYQSFEDYREREDGVSGAAAVALMKLTGAADPDYRDKLPENAFLKKYGYLDEKGRLLGKDGELVDYTGRRINENGQFVNEKDELVDAQGQLVDEFGNQIGPVYPFEDEAVA